MSNSYLKITPHSTWALTGANVRHRSLESRIVILDTVQQISNAAMFVGQLVRHVLSASFQRDVRVPMLSGMTLKGIIALTFPFNAMKQRFLCLDFTLPFVLTSELIDDCIKSATSILSPLERLFASSNL